MRFDQTLTPAILVRRYKRFLADVILEDDGRSLTVHCPNSGSMLGCSAPGSRVMLSRSDKPHRKYPHTLEMVLVGSSWVGVNTSRTNALVREAVERGLIREIGDVERIVAEIKTSSSTRLDFLLRQADRRVYLEVKNCSLAEKGMALFPDAVTRRGTKHLLELAALHAQGHGAIVFFCVQRGDASCFAPAGHIDPTYAATLSQVQRHGVQVLAYQAAVDPAGITVVRPLPCLLPKG